MRPLAWANFIEISYHENFKLYILIEQHCKQIFTYTRSHTVNNESDKVKA
jgi:hypothetical protein